MAYVFVVTLFSYLTSEEIYIWLHTHLYPQLLTLLPRCPTSHLTRSKMMVKSAKGYTFFIRIQCRGSKTQNNLEQFLEQSKFQVKSFLSFLVAYREKDVSCFPLARCHVKKVSRYGNNRAAGKIITNCDLPQVVD